MDTATETTNHFRCIDMMIDRANGAFTEKFIKELQAELKTGTIGSRKDWLAAGDYKRYPDSAGETQEVSGLFSN